MRNAEIQGSNPEHRTRAHELHVHCRGESARDYQWNKRPRLELKQEQFDGQNHTCDWSVERRRHTCSRATGQQYLALGSSGVKDLPDE